MFLPHTHQENIKNKSLITQVTVELASQLNGNGINDQIKPLSHLQPANSSVKAHWSNNYSLGFAIVEREEDTELLNFHHYLLFMEDFMQKVWNHNWIIFLQVLWIDLLIMELYYIKWNGQRKKQSIAMQYLATCETDAALMAISKDLLRIKDYEHQKRAKKTCTDIKLCENMETYTNFSYKGKEWVDLRSSVLS